MNAETKSYVTLRVVNWILFVLIFLSSIQRVLSSGLGSLTSILVVLALFLISGNYIGTAIAISPKFTTILGYPVVIGKMSRNTLIATNSILLLLGLLVSGVSLINQQYIASFICAIYLAISLLNVMALRSQNA